MTAPYVRASREQPADAVDAVGVHGEHVVPLGVQRRPLAHACGVVVVRGVVRQRAVEEPRRPAARKVRLVAHLAIKGDRLQSDPKIGAKSTADHLQTLSSNPEPASHGPKVVSELPPNRHY